MELLNRINVFHKSSKGYLLFGAVELALAYLLASVAIDTANMWVYAGTLILLAGAFINFVNVFRAPKNKKNGNKER